jgi:hypothetical protein
MKFNRHVIEGSLNPLTSLYGHLFVYRQYFFLRNSLYEMVFRPKY